MSPQDMTEEQLLEAIQQKTGFGKGDVVVTKNDGTRSRMWPGTDGETYRILGFGVSKRHGPYAELLTLGYRDRDGTELGPTRSIPLSVLRKKGK